MAQILKFVPNLPDDAHCLQASFMMVSHSGVGRMPSYEEAEQLTGFVADQGTWQFETMLAFAGLGFTVWDHENFEPEKFVADAEATIRNQVGNDDVATDILAQTDLELEVARVQQCLAHERVSFRSSVPTIDDVVAALEQGAFVIANVNSKVLHDQDGYSGHFVVVEEVSSSGVRLQDPGLPPRPDVRVSLATFRAAWMFPSPDMANYIAALPPESAR